MTHDPRPVTPTEPTISESIASRRATRLFLPKAVGIDTITAILTLASRAPSAVNTQPWHVHALSSTARERLSSAVIAAYDAGDSRPDRPVSWFGPYRRRQLEFGKQFYGSLGIDRDDSEGRKAQQRMNFRFYGAPVGLIFTIDARLPVDSWLDCGMFIQNVMLGARAFGLDTCPQGCWKEFPHVVSQVLSLGEHETLVCGMAVGYAHPEAIARPTITDREPIEQWSHFHGFDSSDTHPEKQR